MMPYNDDYYMKKNDYIYHTSGNGHRKSYADTIGPLLHLSPITQKPDISLAFKFIGANRLFFGLIEETWLFFLCISLIRTISGKKTSGILMTIENCFNDNFQSRTKFHIFRFLSRRHNISIISIQPTTIRPHFAQVTNHWVHDPQLWDYSGRNRRSDDFLAKQIKAAQKKAPKNINSTKNQIILSFVGSVTTVKSAIYLSQIIQQYDEFKNKVLVIIGGKIAPDCRAAIDNIKDRNILIFDRFITDIEIETIYAHSDYIWCCYHPRYDQASGIFGRAVQFGCGTIVREHSMISEYGDYTKTNIIPVPYDMPDRAAKIIMQLPPHKAPDNHEPAIWKQHFLSVMNGIL